MKVKTEMDTQMEKFNKQLLLVHLFFSTKYIIDAYKICCTIKYCNISCIMRSWITTINIEGLITENVSSVMLSEDSRYDLCQD